MIANSPPSFIDCSAKKKLIRNKDGAQQARLHKCLRFPNRSSIAQSKARTGLIVVFDFFIEIALHAIDSFKDGVFSFYFSFMPCCVDENPEIREPGKRKDVL
jgi:hypothetical protein